ncbi:zinc/iron-chelating domain-containing protein [Helicobacter valdiviensis]|uniref:Zinc/iron-chelating domain-containing protein n=1 Tax=Helicobacter valdiviensis TaxID=1458358 RepID=A0A2W6MSR3_9HELI|nr:YkgJ family cysteine cluster protein [Helicobacter valdiviensis]PZT47462.1 zinc/iron-chelating domain-containing protein [Helicobacter valdiviensis]
MLKQEGYRFSFDESKCKECGGKCCKGESGYVYLTLEDMQKIAEFLGMDFMEFTQKYIRKLVAGYSLLEKKEINGKGYACIFLNEEKGECEIYKVRPMQCRTFPFWQGFKQDYSELKNECMGIVDEI